MIEIKILDLLRTEEMDYKTHIIRMKEAFLFRNHLCITFEMLSVNLFDMLKSGRFKGCDVKIVKNMAIQMLIALRFMKQQSIVHCDLKPENILLKHYNKSLIKIIDFGSGCFMNE
jgi:dual specificity tyrosine-phosphorylation-regulated kinase 2/3/4